MISKPYSSVIVTGSVAYDQIMNFPDRFINHFHPEKLHQINVSFALNKMEKQIGGTGLNIAYNVKLASKNNQSTKIILLAAVGKDGNEFVKFCRKNQIDNQYLIKDKRLYSASGIVITDQNDNQIWGFYYGACQKAATIDIKKILDNYSLLVISANHPQAFLHFQNQAIAFKTDYLYDSGMSLTWISDKDLQAGVNHCCFLVGNDYEIAMILKRLKISIKELTNKGVKIITTLGEKGVRYESRSGKTEVGSWKVKKVVDPTGAGDAWRGGFVAGLLENKPLVDCLKLGNIMASFAIEKYGTVNHRPSKKDVEKRLKTI